MHPILFEIYDTKIQSYGFFIALGYISSLLLGIYLAKSRKRATEPFLDLALISILFGVIGARGFFLVTNLQYFEKYPSEIFNFWSGGLVFYGGFIVAMLANIIYLRWRKIPIAETFDICAPALALGHAIGRIGCLLAGCCHGSTCHWPWAVTMNTDLVDPMLRNIPIHPVQAYESITLIALSMILFFIVKKNRLKAGGASLVYLMGYSTIRFILEYFRGDSIRGFLLEPWISTSQGISIFIFISAAAILVRGFRSNN